MNNKHYAALDLGSNSFHLIICQHSEHGLQTIDKIKHMVRLGEGLDKNKNLSPESIERALHTLKNMGERLRELPRTQIRAVGTNTLRIAKNAQEFLQLAEKALGFDIEIISGEEEARLIYLGITAHNSFNDHNLIIDIGGGSTEIIFGKGKESQILHSLNIGCANMAQQFFPKGKINKNAIEKALKHIGQQIEPYIKTFTHTPHQHAILSSGTAKAVEKVLQTQNLSENGVEKKALEKLLEQLIDIGRSDKLSAKLDLDPERAFGFTGGVVILYGLMTHLQIKRAIVSQSALREGVLFDLINVKTHKSRDMREITCQALQQRFSISKEQARRVKTLALHLYKAMPQAAPERFLPLLDFACELHEIGLAVSRHKQQQHGAYLLENSDLLGFSTLMQKILALLTLGQRKKIPKKQIETYPEAQQAFLWHFLLALRLSIVINRSRREIAEKDYPEALYHKQQLRLKFNDDYLKNHPLSLADLQEESNYWQDTPITFIIQ